MSDVDFARAPRWLQWLYVIGVNAIEFCPVVITFGRLQRLKDAENMVAWMHEQQQAEARTRANCAPQQSAVTSETGDGT
jgi:hypothetical protein